MSSVHDDKLKTIVEFIVTQADTFSSLPLDLTNQDEPEKFIIDNIQAFYWKAQEEWRRCIADGFYSKCYDYACSLSTSQTLLLSLANSVVEKTTTIQASK